MIHAPLHLPEEATRWAQSRVDAGEAPSVEAYFAELARRDREQAEEAAELQAAIDKGVASGVDPRSADEIFREIFQKHFGVDE